MPIAIKTLSDTPLETLHQALLAAYEDYVVPFNVPFEGYVKMLRERGFQADLSLGAFSGGELVAFWFVGAGASFEPRTLYGLSVGTVPAFRRQGLSEAIFARLIQGADRSAFEQVVLECITHNDRAVAAYRKMGFEERRRVVMMRGTFAGFEPAASLTVEEVGLSRARVISDSLEDWAPTWQNTQGSLEALPDDVLCLAAQDGAETVGLGTFIRSARQIKRLSVARGQDRKSVAATLLAEAAKCGDPEQDRVFVNIDEHDQEITQLLAEHGWSEMLAQYEMVFRLTDGD